MRWDVVAVGCSERVRRVWGCLVCVGFGVVVEVERIRGEGVGVLFSWALIVLRRVLYGSGLTESRRV